METKLSLRRLVKPSMLELCTLEQRLLERTNEFGIAIFYLFESVGFEFQLVYLQRKYGFVFQALLSFLIHNMSLVVIPIC